MLCNKSFSSSTVYPQRTGTDGRFKTWLYRTNGVYYYEGFYKHPTYIEFASNEKIGTIYTPKPNAWEFKSSANRLFLMPIEEDADTTMTVMTNLRTYFFELHARSPIGTIDTDIPFYSKFRYSNANRKSRKSSGDGSIIQYVTTKGPDLSHPEKLNPYYTVSGETSITPIAVFDDGKFTYFEFKEYGTMPAIFSVGSNGLESVVNFRIVNNYLAVEGVYPTYTLRNGAETVCVFNQTMRETECKNCKR